MGDHPDNLPATPVEDDRTGLSRDTFERAVIDHLLYTRLKDRQSATLLDLYHAVAHAVRDRLVHRWRRSRRAYYRQDAKRVYYLSAEYLPGRSLRRNLYALGLHDTARDLLEDYGVELENLLEQELDPGLGNGGLGRLAACYLESMATLGVPGYGYGIRYEFGIFEQQIHDGWQREQADAWLRYGNPWEIPRHEYTAHVHFYGRVEEGFDEHGHFAPRWVDTEEVLGVPYDTPVPGYHTGSVATLRLWSARAPVELDLEMFNRGEYQRAVEAKALGETISKVLYPNDESWEGKELRLKQQYFFVCCSIHDIVRRFKKTHADFRRFPDKVAIQMNDTHPAIAVAELMRMLVDIEHLPWQQAWDITQRSFAYTNHTLLPEALESWPASLLAHLLPRHLSIIYEIDRRFMNEVHIMAPGDDEKKRRMSLIQDGFEPRVRMAHLAVVGSHSINGVAELHSELLRTQLLPDFVEMFPRRFNNKTNGVTPRRWLLCANRELANAITRRLGPEWIASLWRLSELARLEDDGSFRDELADIKHQNKRDLARWLYRHHGVELDPDSIFDVHVKRIHEYKRQILNCLHIISLYRALKADPSRDIYPRTFFFGGKSAPGYKIAKLHIKLINDVASVVNHDPSVAGRLRVFFITNYSVSAAEHLIPAADVSQQISTAGKEASGTGNMKFMMNGALTLGTMDGANLEMYREVGSDAFFRFGMSVDQIRHLQRSAYDPAEPIEQSPALRDALDAVDRGVFSPDDPRRYRELVDSLRRVDPYMVCADFDDYVAAQERVDRAYRDAEWWQRRVVRNLAGAGRFSSDRAVRQYAEEIWDAPSVPVDESAEHEAGDR